MRWALWLLLSVLTMNQYLVRLSTLSRVTWLRNVLFIGIVTAVIRLPFSRLENIIRPLKVLILKILLSNIVLNYLSEERLENLDFSFICLPKKSA